MNNLDIYIEVWNSCCVYESINIYSTEQSNLHSKNDGRLMYL